MKTTMNPITGHTIADNATTTMNPITGHTIADNATTTIAATFFDNDEEGDFGDFQTCNESPTTFVNDQRVVEQTKFLSNVEVNPSKQNIFELDWFQFKTFRTNFEQLIINYFPLESICLNESNKQNNLSIRSQEDVINDCLIWYNLTGSFNIKSPLNFYNSVIFKKFKDSLKLIQKNKDGERDIETNNEDLPANTKKRNNAADEQDIANDLDMHSLIIGSFDEQTSNPNPNNQKTESTLVDVDQVIKEIELLYSNQSKQTKNKMTIKMDQNKSKHYHFDDNNKIKVDALLSLNASTLLDSALKTWQTDNLINQQQELMLFGTNLEIYQNDDFDQQFHSLPANLNNCNLEGHMADCSGDNLNDSVLALKASNVVLNSKLNQNCCEEICFVKSTDDKKPDKSKKKLIEKLNQLSIVQLNELYMELEQIIQIRSEVLVQELALRDELEFEKEQKNTFISLLLSVQNKRGNYTTVLKKYGSSGQKMTNRIIRRNSNDNIKPIEGRTRNKNMKTTTSSTNTNTRSNFTTLAMDLSSIGSHIKETILPSAHKQSPVYLTTVIPYTSSMIPIDLPTLQILIKLLKALNEDSPNVPALLTDYILKVICP